MGKHDKHIEASSEEFLRNENTVLRKKLAEKDAEIAFANETIKKLQEQCSRMSKWASEIEANAQEAVAKKDAEIKVLQTAVVDLMTKKMVMKDV